jgi:hypothetical protein
MLTTDDTPLSSPNLKKESVHANDAIGTWHPYLTRLQPAT